MITTEIAREIIRRYKGSMWAQTMSQRAIARNDMPRAARAIDLWKRLDDRLNEIMGYHVGPDAECV